RAANHRPAMPAFDPTRRLNFRSGAQILDRGARSIGLDAADAGLTRGFRSIHLTGSDHLVIGRLQIEKRLVVGSGLALVVGIIRTVRLDRADAALGRRL